MLRLLLIGSTMKQPRTQEHTNHPVSTLYRHAPRVIVCKRKRWHERCGFSTSEAIALGIVIITLFFI